MSEYQIVKFRAIDRPLTDKQLEFMELQSSRAEFTRWEFQVEYHYSSFHGNVAGMLRNGYDIFLNYANYGSREIYLRLPNGLPFAKSVWSKYIRREGFEWTPDKTGKGGILKLAPYLEEAYDQVWEFDEYLDATAKIREMLIAGDLRALYVLWLCNATAEADAEDGILEPPVPYGLGSFPEEAAELLNFFEVDPLLIDTAALGIPKFNLQGSRTDSVKDWLSTISDVRRSEIIQRLLSEDPIILKADLLSEIRHSQHAVTWPVEAPKRTVPQLLQMCCLLRQREDAKQKKKGEAKAKREAEKAEVQRQARMIEMRSAPEVWLKKASKLVAERGTNNYSEAANILADLRDAIGDDKGHKIARTHAAHLAKKYPTLNKLKSSLRKKQLLD